MSAQQSEVWILLALWGVVAASIGSIVLRLPVWWIFINASFPAALYGFNALELPAWLYLAAFLISLAIFWNAGGERVPLYLTNRQTWQALHELLQQKQEFSFIDIGCGICGTVRYLAAKNPDCRFTGVENAPLPFAVSWFRQALMPLGNLDVRYGDFWQQDFSRFDVVYCFLSPQPMHRLYEKAAKEMKAGTILISNSFSITDHQPKQSLELDD